ncbi:MAG: chymotrypsin family serine protease [Solirubrobacteraceae bacterium]
MIGGMEIWSEPYGGYYTICTGGFMARSIYPESYPDHYLLTAGHCLKGNPEREKGPWTSANKAIQGHQIGNAAYSTIGLSGDGGFIDLNVEHSYWEDSKAWGWYPYVYTPGKEWGILNAYSINIVGTNEPPNIQHQTPCHSTGIKNPNEIVCGVTERTGVTGSIEYKPGELTSVGNLVENTGCSNGGDSGGPWYYNNYAMGIDVASLGCPGHASLYDDLHAIDHVLGMKVVGWEGTVE